jgi:hypothetical protein
MFFFRLAVVLLLLRLRFLWWRVDGALGRRGLVGGEGAGAFCLQTHKRSTSGRS